MLTPNSYAGINTTTGTAGRLTAKGGCSVGHRAMVTLQVTDSLNATATGTGQFNCTTIVT